MKFAEQMGIQVFETSAKDNKNVEEVWVYRVFFFALEKYNRQSLFLSGRQSQNNVHATRIVLQESIIQPI